MKTDWSNSINGVVKFSAKVYDSTVEVPWRKPLTLAERTVILSIDRLCQNTVRGTSWLSGSGMWDS